MLDPRERLRFWLHAMKEWREVHAEFKRIGDEQCERASKESFLIARERTRSWITMCDPLP